MKLYLSGPMTGIMDMNAPAFAKAARFLRKLGHRVFSPVEEDIADGLQVQGRTEADGKTWGDLLSRDVKILSDGEFDAIILLEGWRRSRGARLELALALILGLTIYILTDKLELTAVPKIVAAHWLKEEIA